MALKKNVPSEQDNITALSSKNDARAKREAEEHRRRARTLAKQQQAAEKIASAAVQLASGITEASTARDQLATATNEIATGAEQSSGASQESLAAMTQISGRIARQGEIAELSTKLWNYKIWWERLVLTSMHLWKTLVPRQNVKAPLSQWLTR